MRIVFFSNDRLEVERLSQQLIGEGIPCEVREGVIVREAELWIKKDGDLHRAFMLCVQCSMGFAKRDREQYEIDSFETIAAA